MCSPYARSEANAGGRALVMTGDRDMYQCADDRVTVLYIRTGGRGAEAVDAGEGGRVLALATVTLQRPPQLA